MDILIFWIVGFTALGGVLSVLAAAGFLLLPDSVRARMLSPMVSFAIGALLGAAFLAILPHAFESPGVEGAHGIALTVLSGILGFFLLEKLVIWRHCHTQDCDVHGSIGAGRSPHPASRDAHTSRYSAETTGASGAAEVRVLDMDRVRSLAAGNLILIGDGIHNMVDGVLVAAAFLTDVHLGIVTSVAVIAHEIPQELGDFAILLHSGFSRPRALLYNVLTGLTPVIGGVAAYFSLSSAQGIVPYVLAIAASSFIYIAVADLIPGLHKRPEFSATVQQVALIALGVSAIFVTHSMLH